MKMSRIVATKMLLSLITLVSMGNMMAQNEGAIDSVLQWTRLELQNGISENWEAEFELAQKRINGDREIAKQTLKDFTHLFPSLRGIELTSADGSQTVSERLIWEVAVFEHQMMEQADQRAVGIETPKSEFLKSHKKSRQLIWAQGMAGGLLIILFTLWLLYTRRVTQNRKEDAPNSEETNWIINELESDPTKEETLAQLTVLNFHHAQHPIALDFKHPNMWKTLSDSEQLLAALLFDGIPTEVIIKELKKNPGTVYNLRSSLRKKLNIPDHADLQLSLRQMTQ